MKQTDFDAVVLGGGLVGASLALSLQKQGKQVLLCERRLPETDFSVLAQSWDARIFAISPANRAFLQQLGVWRAERAQTVTRMDVRGDNGGRIVFDAADMAADGLTYMVENRYLLASIWQKIQAAGVVVRTEPVTSVHTDAFQAAIHTEDGATVTARVLVGADGAQSWLRQAVGIDVSEQPYRHHGVVANFVAEKPHQGCAYQWFRDGQVLAYLPLPENQISIVWSTPRPEALTTLPSEALSAAVAAQGQHILGGLQAQTPAFAFELVLRKPATTVAQRVVLAGDAAHTVHPLAGQGVNLGFGDVQCLAALMADAPDIGAWQLLQQYRRSRLAPVRTMQAACNGLFHLFAEQHVPAVPFLRNFGMNAVNTLTPLKKRMIRHAMGWDG